MSADNIATTTTQDDHDRGDTGGVHLCTPISQAPITDSDVQQWEVFNRHGDTPINDVNVGIYVDEPVCYCILAIGVRHIHKP